MAQKLDTAKDVLEDLSGKFKGSIKLEVEAATVNPESILDVCKYLKEEKGFDRMVSLSCVDYPQNKQFALVYHLWSTEKKQLVTLKVFLPRDIGNHVCREGEACDGAASVQSVSSVYHTAEWHEREIFDLFGVNFTNHPNLKRVLLKDDWIGHPLRKDDTSGVPPYAINWKLAGMRNDEKVTLNMKSIKEKLDKAEEARKK